MDAFLREKYRENGEDFTSRRSRTCIPSFNMRSSQERCEVGHGEEILIRTCRRERNVGRRADVKLV
jgi:hypothetical protein